MPESARVRALASEREIERKRESERDREITCLSVFARRAVRLCEQVQCVQPWFACVVCICVQKKSARARERERERDRKKDLV
jgi:hypothetical protein